MPNASAAGTIDIGGDITVNRFGFGAMRITGPGIWGPPESKENAIAVLRRAVEQGINFIDTADSYGPNVSEELIAEALYPYPDDLVIATKAGMYRTGPDDGEADGFWPKDGRPEHIVEACEGSLRRLRLEQIPLFQFHKTDPKVPFEESMTGVVRLKEEGKVLHVGLSNVTEEQIRVAQQMVPIVSIQNRYNVDDRRSESILDLCEEEQMVFIPYAPIQNADNPTMAEISERHSATPRQVALAWLLGRSSATLPIAGTGDPAHLDDNMAALDLNLTRAEIGALTQLGS
ncbi:Predicted oxidoreductase [Asanoa hainanensis]|uniref:Predicted oxidoreductase n=1 Tax=Asanoa hainanensis TaxID=560556 RepID=A0A239PEA1_9ACTN|nr:aldo/keto reductase [Asanoa hainanensis]SNT65396.1 Predicted oxidoreductase [Asanoa hainanensis]